MKFILILLVAVAIVAADFEPVELLQDLEKEWADFKVKFERNFDETEEAERKEIFTKTFEFVNEHNAAYNKGEHSHYVGINQFADRKPEEMPHTRPLTEA